MKVSRYLGSDQIKIQCFLCLLKQDSVSLFLFPHSGFYIIWYYCIIFNRDHIYFIKCFIEIFYYMVFWNETWSEEMDSWQSHALFRVPKIWWSHLYILSSVPWINYLSNRRLAKVKSHWVCKVRKKLEFPTLLLVKSCLPPVDTLKQISHEWNVW